MIQIVLCFIIFILVIFGVIYLERKQSIQYLEDCEKYKKIQEKADKTKKEAILKAKYKTGDVVKFKIGNKTGVVKYLTQYSNWSDTKIPKYVVTFETDSTLGIDTTGINHFGPSVFTEHVLQETDLTKVE